MMKRLMPLVLMVAAVAGCSSKDSDLERFIAQTRLEPAGGVEPLPEVKPYDKYVYAAGDMRSPFLPFNGAASLKIRPDTKRSREFLETFPFDGLKMKGTMSINGKTYGLVQTPTGMTQRVVPGNYLGENDGRIIRIEPSKITIIEIVPDGSGGFVERDAALAL